MFTETLSVLERHKVITREDYTSETERLFTALPFQALLNVLAKNGTITAEEFKNLSISRENSQDKPDSDS